MKKVLITAGSTRTMIDKVRAITNIFSGRTGTSIAKYFASQGCDVTIITSSPMLARVVCWFFRIINFFRINYKGINIIPFKTFEDLARILEDEVINNGYDIIIQSAAISDYKPDGTNIFMDGKLIEVDSFGKIPSNHKALYLKLIQTEKLIDKIRIPWGFKGKLVKFKLEVGISDNKLIDIAKASRKHSDADIIVANCLEWADSYAYVIDENSCEMVTRHGLASVLFRRLIEEG